MSEALLHQAAWWAAATLLTGFLAWLAASPQPCIKAEPCKEYLMTYPSFHQHTIAASVLLALMGHELLSLLTTYLGTRATQEMVSRIQTRCLPSFLLSVIFGVVALKEFMQSSPDWYIAHVMPNSDGLTAPGRPVYTLQWFEWCINVPIMLILAGHCALDRPLVEITAPAVVTNVYVILCWLALVVSNGFVKWLLIVISLAMYAWVSREMLRWCSAYERAAPLDLPSRNLRPLLSSGLVAYLVLYGIVYLSAAFGVIGAHLEQKSFSILTILSKLAYCATFVAIRGDEYHKTLAKVLRKVSVSNVGMISILRGSFDIIVPCMLDACGLCKLPQSYSGDMVKLESILGSTLAGKNFKDLLGQEEAEQFAAYIRNIVRQADSPQSFDATLSTQGTWTCSDGVMPPIAQVLHSKMLCKGQQLHVTIHMSIVPRSAVSFRRERQLVAAIQFMEPGSENANEVTSLATPAFESFSETAVGMPTSTCTTQASEPDSDSPEKLQAGIVASLADLAKLGMSAILKGSTVAGSQCDDEGTLIHADSREDGDEALTHIGAFVSLDRQEEKMKDTQAEAVKIAGVWEGTVSKVLGGYSQRIHFATDCKSAQITVKGQTLQAFCTVDASKEPAHIDIQVVPEGTCSPPPPIPYIFKIDAGRLHLCGPTCSTMERPQVFAGFGLCIMDRVSVHPDNTMPRENTSRTENEPDPEWSRATTEEFSRSSTEETVKRVKKDVIQASCDKEEEPKVTPAQKLLSLVEEKPTALISLSALVVGAAFAVRKAL